MLKASLRSVFAHKVRLALSAVAVVLGVAFVAGSLVFTDTISTAFDKLFDQVSADVTVSKELAFEAQIPGQEIGATTVPASLLPAIAAVPGVAHVEGDVFVENVRVLRKDGELLSAQGAPGFAIDWPESSADSSVALLDGRAPTGLDDLALDAVSAEKADLKIGDRVVLLTAGPRLEVTLVGIFKFGETGNLAGASLSAFNNERAHQLLGSADYTEIVVDAKDGEALEALRDRVQAVIPAEFVAKTKQEQAESAAADIKEGLAFLNIFLLIFAGVAVFVGSFIILNTFTMLVAQRTRELALLRALGANRRQVTTSVLVEALFVGLIGATLGLAVGLGIAAGLRKLFAAIGLDLGNQGLVIEPRTVIVAYAVGVPVTLLAAYFPGRRAGRVPPVAAMRDDVAMPERSLRIRAVLGTLLALAGGGVLAAGLLGVGSKPAVSVGIGVLGVFIGVSLVSPVLSKPFVRVIGALFPVLFGAIGRLSRENALRNPRRTASTASALMIGLALFGTFGVMAASINASIGKLVDQSLNSDYIVSDAAGTPFTPDIATGIRAVPGVASVTQMRATAVRLDGKTRSVAAVSADSIGRSIGVTFVAGDVGGLGDRGLLVDADVAASRGWSVGQEVPAEFAGGAKFGLRVGGVYEKNQMLGGYLISLDTSSAGGVRPVDTYAFVNLADGVSAADVRPRIESVTGSHPEVALKDQGEFKDEQRAQADQLLYMIYGMLALAIVIAVLGIVNTLALSVTERTREIGLLRAVGMSRRQLRRMVRLESVVISLFGAVLGLAIGVGFGIALQQALADEGIGTLAIPGGQMAIFIVVAAMIGVLAAVWPARRAARLDVLRAISSH
jgi:putative ABC transport system permease protein